MTKTKANFLERAQDSILSEFPLSIVLSDPNLPDMPIVFVNRAFEKITGYAASYAVGRNCRFLQGEDRQQEGLIELREGIKACETVSVDLRNYRPDGTRFINRLLVAPLYESDSDLSESADSGEKTGEKPFAFIGIQSVISHEGRSAGALENLLKETQHRVKNHLAMVAGLIRLQQQESTRDGQQDAKQIFGQLSNRVEALSLLYEEFSSPPVEKGSKYDVMSAGAYVCRVVNTIGSLDGRIGIRVNIDCDAVYMPTDRAAKIGLLTSEIVSNMLQHAFVDREEGHLEVRMKEQGYDYFRLTFSDDGIGLGNSNWPEEGNLGARLVRQLVKSIDADLSVSSSDSGTIVTIGFKNTLPSEASSENGRTRLK